MNRVVVALCVLSLAAEARAQHAGTGGSVSIARDGGAVAGAVEASTGEQTRARQLRAGATYDGPVGGVHVIDAASGAAGSFRLNVVSDFFSKSDYLAKGDDNQYVGGAVSLGVTPIEHLEVSAAVFARRNHNDATAPSSVSTVGDPRFDVKGYFSPTRGLTLAGDVLASFLAAHGDTGLALDATSVGLRTSATFDFRELTSSDLPLLLRANAGYTFDNSANSVRPLEDRRRARLEELGATTGELESLPLATRSERLALGVSRVDRTTLAVGAELPFELSPKVAIHPLAEWRLDVPVNRQGYDCTYAVDASGKQRAGTDGCYDKAGFGAVPQSVTLGARVWPFQGLSLLAAVDIGLTGTSTFVQELAPTPPYRVFVGAGYTVDTRPPKPVVVREVVQAPAPQPEPVAKLGRVRGRVVTVDGARPIGDAKIAIEGRPTAPLWGGADGAFLTYELPTGAVSFRIEATGYVPGTCGTLIVEGGDVDVTCALEAAPTAPSPERAKTPQEELDAAGVLTFGSGEVELDANDAELVSRLARVLAANPELRVEVRGHSDDLGSDAYNQQLSLRRAAAVRAALVQAGVDTKRLVSKGYGKSRPLVENRTDAERAKNRRVELVVLDPGQP